MLASPLNGNIPLKGISVLFFALEALFSYCEGITPLIKATDSFFSVPIFLECLSS